MNAINGLKSSQDINQITEEPVRKESISQPTQKTKLSPKEKGDNYERFIANHFIARVYTIAEHGIDNGVKDHCIDLIMKKEKEIYFIQCKNWKASGIYKVRDKEIKVARQDAQDYMRKNPLYTSAGYKMKLLYVMAENVLHGSAYHYIEE